MVAVDSGIRLLVVVQPNASISEFVGHFDGRIKIRIKSAAVDGKANEDLIAYLSHVLDIPKKNVVIKSGLSSRRKTVVIYGKSTEAISECFSETVSHREK